MSTQLSKTIFACGLGITLAFGMSIKVQAQIPGGVVVINDDPKTVAGPAFPGAEMPTLLAKSVPEPTFNLSLLGLGILGTGATLKRKLKTSKSTS